MRPLPTSFMVVSNVVVLVVGTSRLVVVVQYTGLMRRKRKGRIPSCPAFLRKPGNLELIDFFSTKKLIENKNSMNTTENNSNTFIS